MLLFMIYGMLKVGGVSPIDYLKPGVKFPQINENPQLSLVKPMVSSCRIIKDNSDSFIKNDKMVCN